MNSCNDIYTFEELYITKEIKNDEIEQAYALRHKVFAEKLKWIYKTDDGLDIDQYDRDSISIGVFNLQNKLCGCFRIIPYSKHFMIEKDFRFLISKNHKLRKKPDTVEISRFCIDFIYRSEKLKFPFATSKIALLLYKGMYQWCCIQNVRFAYAVVDTKFLRRLNLSCLPFLPVDAPKVMPDGTETVAAIIDWREFEDVNRNKNKSLLQWFMSYEDNAFINRSMSNSAFQTKKTRFENNSSKTYELLQMDNIFSNGNRDSL